MKDVFMITIGWLLGLLGTPIIRTIENHLKKKEHKACINAEVKDLRDKAATIAFMLFRDYGQVNKELIEWFKKIKLGYVYLPEEENLSKLLSMLDEKTDEEIKGIFLSVARNSTAKTLKKLYLPFLSGNMTVLSLFSGDYQRRAFELMAKLSMLNEAIELTMFHYQKTFDSSISPENHDVLESNMFQGYRDIALMAKDLADKCTALMVVKS